MHVHEPTHLPVDVPDPAAQVGARADVEHAAAAVAEQVDAGQGRQRVGEVALAALASAQDLVVVGTPMAGLRGMLECLREQPAPVAWLCKGFEAPRGEPAMGLMGHEIRAEVAPQLQLLPHQG